MQRWFGWTGLVAIAVLAAPAGCGDSDESPPGGSVSGKPCSNDGQCSPPFPYCGGAGECVECLGDGNCSGGYCSPAGLCGECASDAHCGGGEPYCDPNRARCVQCLAPGNCGGGMACDPASGACVPSCGSDGDCGPERPYCGPGNVCVQCLGDGNCGGDNPYCGPNHRCVECLSHANCGGGDFCGTDFQCHGG